MFLLAHLWHCFFVLCLSKFIFNIRFQIAVLVWSIDTERNKNYQGDASSGTACLLEILIFFLIALTSHEGTNTHIQRFGQAQCAVLPCLPTSHVSQ